MPGNDTNEYGAVFAAYQGSGTLRHKGGGEDPCTFSAFQLRDGHIVLSLNLELANPARYFEGTTLETIAGTTNDGHQFSATGLSTAHSVQVTIDPPGICSECRAQRIAVETSSTEATPQSRFAIVNLTLANNDLVVEHPAGKARLRRVAGYEQVVRRFGTVKAIDVTAELHLEAPDRDSREAAADDICALLSVARGTKIQWIAREDYTPSGDRLHRYHFSHVTKLFCPLPAIDPRKIEDTSRFLATAMRAYVERRENWGLSRGLLDAYLDAKSDIDYLQTRGVKLAVAMEMLKESFIQASGYQDLVRPRREFRAMTQDLKNALKKVMEQHHLDAPQRAIVYRNIEGLNRVPFENIVAALCTSIEMDVSDEHRKLFVKCRNSLVHTGRFYCETADDHDRAELPPHPGPVEAYCWLLHFLDRVLLRVVGYRGPYVDWSNPGAPVRRATF